MDKLLVTADFDFLPKEEVVGILGHDNLRGTNVYSFEYNSQWLKDHPDLMLSKDIQPYPGVQYNAEPNKIFGCFSDSLPDRWGRNLIDLKAGLSTDKKGVRNNLKLSDWDYLKGVDDYLRSGAFRFKTDTNGIYLNKSGSMTVPPSVYLDDLLQAAHEVEKSESKHMAPERRWIDRLWHPGTSMGGVRPKAVVQDNGKLYVAKFPSIKDRVNVAKWEFFAHTLAHECGINTANVHIVHANNDQDILLSERFDRGENDKRIHMASSLTLLGLGDGCGSRTGNGYLDIVDFIVSIGGADIETNLEELYRRVAYNIAIGNTDDHFRNHSFLLTNRGWTLSPAYDLNPTNYYNQALLIDKNTDESSLDILYEAHEDYLLDGVTARGIINDVVRNVKYWESVAKDCGLSSHELDYFKDRIEDGIDCKIAGGIHR